MQLITGSCGVERCINMAVTLREIIKQVQHLEMKLVAGETGLDHEVSWTHMVDSDTISAFLQGQELTFTTGLGLNENLTLLRLVKEVWRNKASGIVINTGPYISEIGQDVIDEYSRAMKSHFRKFGNQMSGSGNHLCNYASLLA